LLKGPTPWGIVKFGTPVGKLKPSAARFRVTFCSPTLASSVGNRSACAKASRDSAERTEAPAA
jgi:hypothetical protein